MAVAVALAPSASICLRFLFRRTGGLYAGFLKGFGCGEMSSDSSSSWFVVGGAAGASAAADDDDAVAVAALLLLLLLLLLLFDGACFCFFEPDDDGNPDAEEVFAAAAGVRDAISRSCCWRRVCSGDGSSVVGNKER